MKTQRTLSLILSLLLTVGAHVAAVAQTAQPQIPPRPGDLKFQPLSYTPQPGDLGEIIGKVEWAEGPR